MQACNIEDDYDSAYMQYSIDGGSTWNDIWSHIGADFNSWHELNTDISFAAGHTLLLQWVLETDSSRTEEGYYIDKIQIIAN